MENERLRQLLDRFGDVRIAVVGDFFLDKYLDVEPALVESSVETGKPAHQVVDVRCQPGAAGTVVRNLAALGAGAVHAVGFTGDDGEGYELRRALREHGCTTDHLHVCHTRRTPTYMKPREVRREGLDAERSRYDIKNRVVTPAITENHVIASIDALLLEVDAVIVLDQVQERNCGVVTARVRDALALRSGQYSSVLFWADSRFHINDFAHLIVKSNQFEAVGQKHPQPDGRIDAERLLEAAAILRVRNQAPVVVTAGDRGMYVSDPEWTHVPGVPVAGPLDTTGAGDSATSGAVLALCAGGTLPEAALVGNLVASLTIQQLGTTGVAKVEQLPGQLEAWQANRDA